MFLFDLVTLSHHAYVGDGMSSSISVSPWQQDFRMKAASEGYPSSTFLIVLAISIFVKGFIARSLMPTALTLSTSTSANTRTRDDGPVGSNGEDHASKLDTRHFKHCLVGTDKIDPGRVQFLGARALPRYSS